VTQPEIELNMGKVDTEKARGWLCSILLFS